MNQCCFLSFHCSHGVSLFIYSSTAPHPRLGNVPAGKETYVPVGSSDSEAIFCEFLNALRNTFTELPKLSVLYETLYELSMEIVQSHNADECVIFNFLLACGENILFAFSWPGSRPGSKVWNGLYYLVRSYPFKIAKLKDCDLCVDFAQVTTPDDRVAVIATSPLTEDEAWTEFEKGQLIMFDQGVPHLSADECATAEKQGRGLKSNAFGNFTAACSSTA